MTKTTITQVTREELIKAIRDRMYHIGTDMAHEEAKYMLQDGLSTDDMYWSEEGDAIYDFFTNYMQSVMDDEQSDFVQYMDEQLEFVTVPKDDPEATQVVVDIEGIGWEGDFECALDEGLPYKESVVISTDKDVDSVVGRNEILMDALSLLEDEYGYSITDIKRGNVLPSTEPNTPSQRAVAAAQDYLSNILTDVSPMDIDGVEGKDAEDALILINQALATAEDGLDNI